MRLDIDISEPLFVPIGSEVISVTPFAIELANYDYTPFADPNSPAFDFIADRIHPDGRIDRAVPCTSLPGRITIEKKD